MVSVLAAAVAYLVISEADTNSSTADLPNVFVARDTTQPIVPSDGEITQIVTLALEPGKYLVSGKVGFHNRDPQYASKMECWLTPSAPDGTIGDPDAPESDYAVLNLTAFDEPGDQGQSVLFATFELAVSRSVELSCRGPETPSQLGAFTHFAWVSAIQVESITTEFE